jgi:diazepam-binding inhibitor (GABA receptor modulating acyl-CoA-binding protein)
MAIDDDFTSAQERVKTLKSKPGNDELLELYSLYKQGSSGDVSGARPGMFDLVGKAKYDAWAGKKGLTKDDAKKKYVDYVNKLLAKG